jgi:nicotinate phosphoribosyltransferase
MPIFPPAPLLRVTAALPEAQLVETALLALLTFETSVASRAARLVDAASGRAVVDFGARRAHGIEAGIHAARAAFVGGCEATSNVEAGRRFGIPLSGTMAHSWVMAFPNQAEAFRQFAAVFGDRSVLLLDTYDTVAAAIWVAASGIRPHAVRLDSGDVIGLSRRVREILDAAGLQQTKIFASGDLDEWRIAEIVAAGAAIDAFGVGAALSTSSDAPSLGGVYKLVEIERGGAPVAIMKLSPDKQTVPGRKQVWRIFEEGMAVADVIGLADESDPPQSRRLLSRVMVGGRREQQPQRLEVLRTACRAALAELPPSVRRLRNPSEYPIRFTDALQGTVTALRGPEGPRHTPA